MSPIFKQITRLATEYGYVSLATLAFLDGAGLPFPSEITVLSLVILTRRDDIRLWPGILLAAAANTVGCLVPYFVGRWGSHRLVERWLPQSEARRRRIEAWISGYGVLAIILTRITGIMRLPTIVLLGILEMPLTTVIPSVYVGAVLWLYFSYHIVVFAGLKARQVMEGFRERWWDVAVVAVMLVLAATVYALAVRRARRSPGQGGSPPSGGGREP